MAVIARTVPVPSLWTRLIAVLALCLGTPASGQFMGAGADFGAMGMTRISRTSVQAYGRIAGMDAAQVDAALVLQEGYAKSHESLLKQFQTDMQKIQEEFQDTQDWKVFQKQMPKIAMDFGTKMEELEQGFLSDLRALLTPEQEARWPRVERLRRREQGMRFSMVSGQGVDLVDILGDLKVDAASTPELADQLERYEIEIDRVLTDIERWGKEQQKEWMEDEEAFDFTKMQEMMARAEKAMAAMTEKARAVRDINRQYARTMQPLLPSDHQGRFDAEVKRRSFPRVYRTPWVSKAFAAAAGFDDLSADQKAALSEARTSYERELADANAKWSAAIEAREEKTGGTVMAMMRMQQGGDESGDAVTEARNARRELDDRYTSKLKEIIGEDRVARLPEETRERGDDMFMGMMAVDDLEGEEGGEEDPR